MIQLSPAQRRYLFVEQGLGSIFVNFVLNAGIAWALFRGAGSVPLWGPQSIAGDTIGTCFVLPFLTTLIVSALTWRAVRSGRLEALSAAVHLPFAARPFARGFALSVACVALVAPLTVGGFVLTRTIELSFGDFVAFKATFAALLGAPVTPAVAWAALADAKASARQD